MKENSTNKREWVKNVAIVFLVILLVLTFFSNTILNYSLPEVSAQYIESGTITSKIRGTGNIDSTDPYNVKIKQSRKVESIEVKEGDYVEEGTVLCVLTNDDSTELDNAKEELRIAENQLKTAENAFTKELLTNKYDSSVISNAGNIKSVDEYLAQVAAAKEAVDKAQKELDAQKKVLEDIDNTISALQTQIDITPSSSADISQEQAAYNQAKNNAENAEYRLVTATNSLDAIDREMDRIKNSTEDDIEPDYGSLPAQRQEVLIELDSAKTAKNNADLELTIASNALQSKIDSGDTSSTIANLKNQQNSARANKVTQEQILEQKQKNLDINNNNYEKLLTDIAASYELYDMQQSIDDAKEKVIKWKEKVKKLEEQADGVSVLAPISGTIISINVRSGEEASSEEAIMTMQPVGKGFTMQMTVTNEQAKRLSVGDEAELVNSWRYDDMTIKISSIKPSKSNPGKEKVITFDISGDNVVAGQSISISVGQKSANYDMVIPNSAIREDNDGKFILIVESKSSPIGTRYYATKVPIEVLASDDTKSAISGAVYGNEFVITTSNKPVDKNKQIRLAE